MRTRAGRTARRAFAGLAAAAAIAGLTGAAGRAGAEERIVLKPSMLFDETVAGGNPANLVDEQDAIGDPAAKAGQKPKTPYFPGWGDSRYPVSVLIDLGSETNLTRLFIYNDTGDAPLVLSTGRPFAWKPQDITIKGYQQWCEFPLNTRSRYLRLTLKRPTNVPEIALYGDRPAPTQPTPSAPRKPHPIQPTMDQMIGTNAFIDDPIDTLAAPVGFVREYHCWGWDTENPDGKVRFQPSAAGGGNSWFFDDYYRKLKAAGVTVAPAIQQSSNAYFPGYDVDWKPVAKGADPESPASYAIHSAHLFQYAARYGAARVPDSELQLAPGQPRSSGLGLLRYIENWNEPDKTWKGAEGRFNPYALAAMCSADYDGDMGRLGKGHGVRGADAGMKLVVGGLAGIHVDYWKAMKLWADFNRKGDFPADVINVHHYCSDGDDDQGFKSKGVSPEEGQLREKIGKLVAWRNENLPDREIWITEFGYDTHPGSPLHAPAVGSYTAEDVQAIWLVRSYLALAAAGVDRAAMFMFRDVDPKSGGVFSTCGLVTEKGAWKPKPSYYYLATLKRRMAGMRFAGEVATGNKDVLAYRFTGPAGATAYAVWCGTSTDAKVAGFALPVAGKAATRVDFAGGKLDGEAAPIAVSGGKVMLDVREKPVLILVK